MPVLLQFIHACIASTKCAILRATQWSGQRYLIGLALQPWHMRIAQPLVKTNIRHITTRPMGLDPRSKMAQLSTASRGGVSLHVVVFHRVSLSQIV